MECSESFILFLNFLLIFTLPVKCTLKLGKNELVGLYPPVFTPFTNDKYPQLNLSLIETYAKHLKSNGIPGVLVCGTTGEGPTITLNERKQLLDAWLKAARPIGLSIMMQVAALPFQETLELARYAGKQGVDAILALPELYYRPRSVSDLVWYMKQIAKEAPNTPILYYDIPVTGVSLNMVQFFAQATCEIPNFVGLKTPLLSGIQVISHIQLRDYQRIFILTDQAISLTFEIGLNGTVSGSAGFFPIETTAMVKAIEEGDTKKAREIQITLDRRVAAIAYFEEIDETGDTVSSLKAAMEIITGLPVGPSRPPLPTVGIAKKRAIAQSLVDLGVEIAVTP